MYEDDNTLLVVYHCSLLLKEFSPRTLTKATCYPCHVVFMLDVKSRGLGYHIIFNKIVYIYFSGHEHMLHSTKWFFQSTSVSLFLVTLAHVGQLPVCQLVNITWAYTPKMWENPKIKGAKAQYVLTPQSIEAQLTKVMEWYISKSQTSQMLQAWITTIYNLMYNIHIFSLNQCWFGIIYFGYLQ